MGHASIALTYDKYGHLMKGGQEEAASLLDDYLGRMTRATADAVKPLNAEV